MVFSIPRCGVETYHVGYIFIFTIVLQRDGSQEGDNKEINCRGKWRQGVSSNSRPITPTRPPPEST
ncbi:hypothetical protein J6590_055418 [Homalodisca vitripennis]|nr:hypothetical protein J6590_055418 [Homalodisca vitripennis]